MRRSAATTGYRVTRGMQVALLVALTGCGGSVEAQSVAPPARVERASNETELATVHLTPEAERRLGIVGQLAAVERRAIASWRALPGTVATAPGGAALVVAPFAGTIALVESSELPQPGRAVGEGEALLLLRPVLSPADRINVMASLADADGQVARARAEVEAAEVTLRRVEPLVAERALARRTLDDARAALDTARAALGAAHARRDTIAAAAAATDAAPVRLTSPIGGVVRDLRASPGELVAAGAVVAEVVALSPLRVRVAVPRVELEELDRDGPARVAPLASHGAGQAGRWTEARPVASPPPTVGLLPGAIDLLYELTNEDVGLLPGERVAVELRGRAVEPALVVPWRSVVQDAVGGQWVYVSSAAGTYVRRRVHVLRVHEDDAVLDPACALDVGSQVVTAGAAELFGIEFGVGQ